MLVDVTVAMASMCVVCADVSEGRQQDLPYRTGTMFKAFS